MKTNRVKASVFRVALATALLGGARGVAQQSVEYVAPGSTVYGDAKRGEGQFLKGLAWYELHSAQARSIEAATERANAEWLRKSFEFDQAQRAARIQRANFRTQQAYEARLREAARNEERWRSSPTERDVVSGDALNALLLDLSNPTIPPSDWRYARIDLPAGTSIASLVFRFIPKLQDKGSHVLGGSLIALGRLDPKNWSSSLSGKEMEKEVKDYGDVYRSVIAQSVAGRIDFQTILKMDAALAAVETKARTAIPKERNYQATALAALRDVKAATKMFDAETLDFVREIIADTSGHDAQTVGELVAFMRKYRLAFADVQKSPVGGETYHALYRLMREQKDKLGVGSAHDVAGADDPGRLAPPDALEHDGSRFKVFREELTWHDAKEKCETMGGRLAVVDDAAKARFVTNLLTEARVDAWLGATDEATEGRWIWVDGSPVRYVNWGPYQPNNKQNAEHYLIGVTTIAKWDGKWSDQPDRALEPHHPGFVCEWPAAASPSVASAAPGAAAATITGGKWRIDGRDLLLDSVGNDEFCVFGDPSWSDYDLEFQAEVVRGKEGFFARVVQADDSHYVKAAFGAYTNQRHLIQIATPQDPNRILARWDGSVDQFRTYSVKVSVRGKTVTTFLNGEKVLEATDERFTRGRVGVGSYFTSVRFRNIVVTSASGRVLFKGLPELPDATASQPPAATDPVRAGSTWKSDVHALRILERDGERFKARFETPSAIRDVAGRIAGNRIVWLARDVVAVKGARGDDNFGEFRGDEMVLKWGTYQGQVKGEIKLKRQP